MGDPKPLWLEIYNPHISENISDPNELRKHMLVLLHKCICVFVSDQVAK